VLGTEEPRKEESDRRKKKTHAVWRHRELPGRVDLGRRRSEREKKTCGLEASGTPEEETCHFPSYQYNVAKEPSNFSKTWAADQSTSWAYFSP
jgi:hypothetical protein